MRYELSLFIKTREVRDAVGRLVGVVIVLVGAVAFAQDEWWDAEPVVVTPDVENGGVLFDASGTKKLFPSPTEPRTFETQDDFVAFLKDQLQAEIVEAEGKEVGIQVKASMVGDAYRLTEMGEVTRIGCDIVGEFLAGEFGYIKVAGEQVFIERKPCWEDATEYLTGVRRGNVALVGGGGGCSTGGYCIANATWSSRAFAWYQGWGSSTFQSRSQITCRARPNLPAIPWLMECTGLPTTPNSLSATAALLGPAGPQSFSVVARQRVLASNVLRVDAELVEWKWPWQPGGLVWNSTGVCGVSSGVLSAPLDSRSA